MKKVRAGLVTALLLLVALWISSAAGPKTRQISVAEYKDKVYASWLAQCIGNVYGLPHENDYIDEPGPETFPYGYTESAQRLRQLNGVFSDDDTDIEYMYLLSMEKFGPEPTLADLASLWKHHVRERVWLANRAALAAMHHGYTPPITGLRKYNPHWFQIDPQLINEIWAVTAPGMVRYAAEKSAWAARIMDDEWGIEPTIFYGAMYSEAFFESDIHKLIEAGLAHLPKGSRFAQTVADMKALHQQYPNDWKAARKEMAKKYYHDEPANSKTIWNANLNGAAGVLAMLYGKGDFQYTLDLSCAMGFDADNQAATVAGLLGIVLGSKGLPRDLLFPFADLGWTEPLNDFYKNVTRYDMPDAGLKDLAERMAVQGEKIILQHGGRRSRENGRDVYVINTAAEFVAPLEFPSGPGPFIETGSPINFDFPVFGGKPPYRWQLETGSLPEGLRLENGKLSGVARSTGVYPVRLRLSDQTGKSLPRSVKLVVRGKNLAPSAAGVLAGLEQVNTARLDGLRVSVPRSLFTPSVEVIRDGKLYGDGSTFYSIGEGGERRDDYYGYEWREPQTIGLIGYHGGSVEESGGWFTSLRVEFRNAQGEWAPAEGLLISPPLAPGEQPFNKPHFIEYLLAFRPVETTAIRIIGRPGGGRQRQTELYFTSITELTVHGPLPRYEHLNR